MLEKDLQRVVLCDRKATILMGELVTECPGDCLAHLTGWSGMYITPLKSRRGWRTPARGDLGPGWPDLTLVHPGRGLIFAEVKGSKGRLREDQLLVHARLRAAALRVYVWWPADLDNGRIYRDMTE